MNNQLSVETAVCTEHQTLLAECQRALEIWNEHRAEFVSFVSSEEKQATNSCDCKRSMLELPQGCRTPNATAHSVNWRQECKDVIMKTVRTLYPTTKCAPERRLLADGNRPRSQSFYRCPRIP